LASAVFIVHFEALGDISSHSNAGRPPAFCLSIDVHTSQTWPDKQPLKWHLTSNDLRYRQSDTLIRNRSFSAASNAECLEAFVVPSLLSHLL